MMYIQPRTIVLLGPPGSGKGTQAARLSALLDIPAISTGEILRRECQSGSDLGRRVDAIIRSGRLVEDDQMNQIVSNRLRSPDCRGGCILDGFPRTAQQASFLDQLLSGLNMPEPTVFDFTVSADELISRLEKRRQCPACSQIYSMDTPFRGPLFCPTDGSLLIVRADDRPTAIRERLELYSLNISPLVRYYQERDYTRIAAGASPDVVASQVAERLGLAKVQDFAASARDSSKPASTPNFC
jgi:adenylate kinase